jgi:Putative Ig domain
VDERGKSRDVNVRGCDIGAYDTGGSGGVAKHTWFVAPSGSGSDCASNSSTQPFATLQAAVACAGDGDVISVAASGANPYPGIGAVTHSVSIKAAPGADARTVKIDLGQPADGNRFSSGFLSVPSSASVRLQGLTLTCNVQLNCLSQNVAGSLVTNNGALALTAVTVTGAKHGAPINDVSTGTVPARLTMLDSAIVHNANDGLGSDAAQAGAINAASASGGAPQPHLALTNTTIAANVDSSGDNAGAIHSTTTQAGAITLTNDTITANEGEAGGILDLYSGPAPPVILTNTVLAGNISDSNNPTTKAPDCAGTLGDGPGGHNILGDDNNCPGLTDGTNGDQVGTDTSPLDPRLGPAALNRGTTATAPPLSGSSVIGTANTASCVSGPVFGVDQRGNHRVGSRDACDIGAFDTGGSSLAYAAPSITSAASATATHSKPFVFTVRTTGTPTSAITETGNLPDGMTLVDNGNGTATLAGTPGAATAGTYPITISASNGVDPAATQSFTLTVR